MTNPDPQFAVGCRALRRWFCLAMVLATAMARADGNATNGESGTLWRPVAPGRSGELPDSDRAFRLAPGDQLTVVAKLRRIPVAKGNAAIVTTPGWSFGVREDGALFFDITGRGQRISMPTEVSKVAPLYVPMTAPWPPAELPQNGHVPNDSWTTVAWAVNTKGTWGNAFRFYIDGAAQQADQGWGPLDAPPSEGAVRCGAVRCGSPGLELAEVRIFNGKLSAVEIAELSRTGELASQPAATAAVPVPKPAPRTTSGRRIFAHRMIGFGPSFAGNPDTNNLAWGAGGFLVPVKRQDGPDVPGWCREGHLGALHEPFEN